MYDFAIPLSAKSVAIDLLSTLPSRYPVPVGALVRAAVILGVGENSMRVALARLRARGLVRSDGRGFYQLGADAEPLNRHVRSWRGIEDRVCPWDGSWVGLGPIEGAASRGASLAARLLGFRPLSRSLHIRPNNLVGGVAVVRKRLESVRPGTAGPVFRLSELALDTDRRARTLWEPRALEGDYRATCDRLQESEERLPTLSKEAAMSESFRLGGEAVRQIVLDPLLPEPIVDVTARRALVEAMQRYDEIGRHYWKAWAGESAALQQSPAAIGGLTIDGLAATQETQPAPDAIGERRPER
ncbi:MAG: PaaX family transcriptional regulator [bacterium]|nr:PaaX family transcriptional regulator [bacterium]